MPSSLEHLRTFSERPHMSTEQRKGAERACSGAGCECVEHCGSAINREAVYQRGAMRALIIHVCGSFHGHKYDVEPEKP